MKAVLPVAGIGTRLRPHTHTTPKVLVHVAGKPILGHILDALVPLGVDEVVLIVGQWGDRIVDYVGSTYSVRVRAVEQAERKGLGHAIHLAAAAVGGAEPVLIVLGDTICRADLASVVGGGESAIGVKEVANPRQFGIAEVAGGRIIRLVEKPAEPPSNLAVVGVYYLRQSGPLFECLDEIIARDIRVKGEYQLTDALQMLIERGETVRAFPVDEWWDCGNPETLLATNRHLLETRPRPVPQFGGSIIIPPVAIAPTARLEHCIVGPYVSVADRVELARSIIRNSIISEDARVEDVLLDGSLIGERAAVCGSSTELNIGDSSSIRIGR